jgi:HSP20 family molecular chaperone IbpA
MRSDNQKAFDERLTTAEKVFAKKPLTEFLNTPTFLDGSMTTTCHPSCSYTSANIDNFSINNAANIELSSPTFTITNTIGTSDNITYPSSTTIKYGDNAIGPFVGDVPNYWQSPLWWGGWHWDWYEPYPYRWQDWSYWKDHNFTKEDADKMLRDIEKIVKDVPNKIEKELVNTDNIPADVYLDSEKKLFIDVALAGYNKQDLTIKVEEDYLIVQLSPTTNDSIDISFIQRGIKKVEKDLKFYVDPSKWNAKEANVKFDNGLLHISIKPITEKKEQVVLKIN